MLDQRQYNDVYDVNVILEEWMNESLFEAEQNASLSSPTRSKQIRISIPFYTASTLGFRPPSRYKGKVHLLKLKGAQIRYSTSDS